MTTATIPEKWRFGDAGDRYPIQVGDVWKVGPHLLACGDLERGAAKELIGLSGVPKMLHSDPPWSAGQARSYRTWAGVNRGKVNYLGSLIPAIMEVADQVDGEVWFEMNDWNLANLLRMLEGRGYTVDATWPITSGTSKSPCSLVRSHRDRWTGRVAPDFSGHNDLDTPTEAIEFATEPGELVFDTCTGMGLTALAAHTTGRVFAGTELHPRRLAVAIDRLVTKDPSLHPAKVSELRSMA